MGLRDVGSIAAQGIRATLWLRGGLIRRAVVAYQVLADASDCQLLPQEKASFDACHRVRSIWTEDGKTS